MRNQQRAAIGILSATGATMAKMQCNGDIEATLFNATVLLSNPASGLRSGFSSRQSVSQAGRQLPWLRMDQLAVLTLAITKLLISSVEGDFQTKTSSSNVKQRM